MTIVVRPLQLSTALMGYVECSTDQSVRGFKQPPLYLGGQNYAPCGQQGGGNIDRGSNSLCRMVGLYLPRQAVGRGRVCLVSA